jgi:hypothetical protein
VSARDQVPVETPAEAEYRQARLLLNAQEFAHPVIWRGMPYFIQSFRRDEDPTSSALVTCVYLKGCPDLVPANELTLQEQPK